MSSREPALVVLALALGLGCSPPGPADPVILSLGEQRVRRSDFERQLERLASQGVDVAEPGVRRALLETFLEERVLVLEARGRGLVGPGGTAEQEQAAAQRLLAAEVKRGLSLSDDEVAAHYEQHPEDCREPEAVMLRQILVPTENEARDVRRRLGRQPRDFERLAQTRSHAPEASAGGLMGSFERGQLPAELERAAFVLAPGGFSDVVKTPFGYHVLRLDARRPQRERTLEECRDQIHARLLRAKSDRAAREFVRGLLLRAKVNHEAAQAAHPS